MFVNFVSECLGFESMVTGTLGVVLSSTAAEIAAFEVGSEGVELVGVGDVGMAALSLCLWTSATTCISFSSLFEIGVGSCLSR